MGSILGNTYRGGQVRFSKWVVKYTKLFTTGPLKDMEVEREVTYSDEGGAKGFCDYVTASPIGMDAVTRRLFTVIKSSYEEVVTYESNGTS